MASSSGRTASQATTSRNVLILPAWFPSREAPLAASFIQEQAQVIARRHSVRVLIPEVLSWRRLLRQKVVPWSQAVECSLQVYRVQTLAPVPRSASVSLGAYCRAAEHGFERLVRTSGRPDIIHAHAAVPAGLAAARLGRNFAIPVVLSEHYSRSASWVRPESYRRRVREALLGADSVVAVSPAQAGQLRGLQDGLAVSVVPNMVLTSFFVPASPDGGRLDSRTSFLFVGRLIECKGVAYLLDACRLLVQRGIASFLVLIGGNGPLRSELEDKASSLGLSDHCRFLGSLSRVQVRARMQECDVFVLPSLEEAFGIVLGEAMACGKPVITTRCGGAESVVTPETGLLVDTADPAALADSMEAFIVRRVSFDPLEVRRSVVERYGEERFLSQMSALYDRVLDAKQ